MSFWPFMTSTYVRLHQLLPARAISPLDMLPRSNAMSTPPTTVIFSRLHWPDCSIAASFCLAACYVR